MLLPVEGHRYIINNHTIDYQVKYRHVDDEQSVWNPAGMSVRHAPQSIYDPARSLGHAYEDFRNSNNADEFGLEIQALRDIKWSEQYIQLMILALINGVSTIIEFDVKNHQIKKPRLNTDPTEVDLRSRR